ncbi:MAG: hypothetical protein KatS3mg105_0710 [Gemmatales bacterium]|nr:MAG: hypothetical protein KatS3mg105_0710 [Gemmatales bacterium]
MFACSYGAAFGAIQQIPQIIPGLKNIQEETKDLKSPAEKKKYVEKVAAQYTKMQELGGLTGRFVFALLTVYIVSRRNLLRVFQLPGLIILCHCFLVSF